MEYKLLSLTYKVLTTTQPPYLHKLISIQRSQSWITQWAKGAAAQGPQSRGAPKANLAKTKKFHIEFYRRHAMQCFMCVQCMVIVD